MNPARLPEGIPEDYLLDLFHRSGGETLQRIRDAARRWAETGSEAELADIRRLAHNLKGSSCQLGFDEIAHLAAAVEMYAGELLRHRRPASPRELALFEDAVRLATAALDAVATAAPMPDLGGVTRRLEEEPR